MLTIFLAYVALNLFVSHWGELLYPMRFDRHDLDAVVRALVLTLLVAFAMLPILAYTAIFVKDRR